MSDTEHHELTVTSDAPMHVDEGAEHQTEMPLDHLAAKEDEIAEAHADTVDPVRDDPRINGDQEPMSAAAVVTPASNEPDPKPQSEMARMMAWVRQELHLHSNGVSAEDREQMNPEPAKD